MLDTNDVVVVPQLTSNHFGSLDSLLDVQIRGWLVEHQDIVFGNTSHQDRKPLQLTTGKLSDLPV